MVALPDARVVMVARQGCHLCDEARAIIARVVAETGDSFAEVDIDADPELARYTEEVPVTFVDGRQHDYWRVDAGRLAQLDSATRARGCEELIAALSPKDGGPERIQTFIVSGHKADFGVFVLDPDPLKIDAVKR